jgi:hypothetical protein
MLVAMLTQYNFGNSFVARRCDDPNYLKLNPKGGVPTLVHDGKPVSSPPHLRRLHDLISETEFSEMRAQGPKIADELAGIIAEVRRNSLAVMR